MRERRKARGRGLLRRTNLSNFKVSPNKVSRIAAVDGNRIRHDGSMPAAADDVPHPRILQACLACPISHGLSRQERLTDVCKKHVLER
jgi:hypothetical protein